MARLLLRWLTASACLLTAACATSQTQLQEASSAHKDSGFADQSSNADAASQSFPLTTQIDASIPKQFRKEIEIAQIAGRYLFREDRAAWVASDSLVEQGILTRHRGHASGWLSEQLDVAGNLWNVAFTGNESDASFVFADVSVEFTEGRPKISVHENDPPRELSDLEVVLTYGRDKVKNWDWLRCAETYNSSTQLFIDEGKKYIVVRLLPAQTIETILPMGGFHRFRIPMFEGGHIEHFSQTKACLDSDTSKLGADETFGMTLLTTATPTEFDVFTSLSYGKAHYVITKDGSWRVEKGKIHWLGNSLENTP